MGLAQSRTRTYTGLKGRDGYPTYPGEIPQWRALECLNVDGYRAGFARKRGGATNIFDITTGEAFTGQISAMHRHIPGSDPTAAELWAIDNAATVVTQRLTGGTAWTTPSFVDAITAASADITFCSFKGKLFIAYDSAVDRLHVWDPADATVRRTGLATPSSPTVANTGAGAYAATIRYYKQRYVKKSGAVYLLASELSSAVSFTPSGGGTAARITKAAAINEGETHWQMFGSEDNNAFKLIAETVVGTTTYDDSVNPSAYSGEAPPLVGTHTNWTSVRYLLATDDHLLGAGSYEVPGKTSRVWWSGVTNQTGIGDEESVIQTTAVSNYVDLDENDGGQITGFGGPLDGRPIVFKRNAIWRLVPTGQDDAFYRPVPIYKGLNLGCIRQQTVVNGEDGAGRPCVYWLSDIGPYRIGADGPQALGDDVQDLWDTVNLEASIVVGHGIWYPAKRQVWWWIATGANTDPDTRIIFDVRKGRVYDDSRVRDGWYKHTGASCLARCSVLFSNTLGASMSRDLKPHIGRSPAAEIYKCDTADLSDAGTAFQAYVDLPDTHFSGIDHVSQLGTPILVGSAGSHSLAVTLVKDYGTETVGPASTSMAASGTETRVTKVVEGIEGADAHAMRIRIGDSAAIANSWTLDAVGIRVETREPV